MQPERSLRSKRVVLAPPDNEWQVKFERERDAIEAAIPLQLSIEHVGSTAIGTIHAKPIIDILVGVPEQHALTSVAAGLETLGYVHDVAAQGDDPERHVFRKGPSALRTHQVHVTTPGGRYWNRLIAFRDYLATHPAEAAAYEELKRQLAREHEHDGRRYTQGKAEFVRRIEQVAFGRTAGAVGDGATRP